jgi:(p)ppGpp synthase/HD superfamily hydrolase
VSEQTSVPPYVLQADRIADQAHTGQVDKAGVPYINHPRAVSMIVVDLVHPEERWMAMTAALLHDILEDTDMTPFTLELVGIPLEAIQIVKDLTHHKGEPRSEYLNRILVGHPLALPVKIADVTHNMDEDRLAGLDEVTAERLRAKYSTEYALLNAEFTRRMRSSWASDDV